MQVLAPARRYRSRRTIEIVRKRKERIVLAYLVGLTAEQIAGAYGFSKQRAHEILTEELGRISLSSTIKRGQYHRIPEVLAALNRYYEEILS